MKLSFKFSDKYSIYIVRALRSGLGTAYKLLVLLSATPCWFHHTSVILFYFCLQFHFALVLVFFFKPSVVNHFSLFHEPRTFTLLQVHLIEGIIDQVEGTVHVSWVQPRVLGISQIKSLRDRLDNWMGKVHTALLSVEAETPDLVAS